MRVLDFIASLFLGVTSIGMVLHLIGQAMTGGVRTTEAAGPVSADSAVVVLVWLVCAIWLSARTQWECWK